jgi:hypothetical protein
MSEETEFHDPESRQITQIAPPIFPDNLMVRLHGGFGRLAFVTIPDVSKPNNVLVVADIVLTPDFMLSIAEKCLAAVKMVSPDAKIDDDRVEKILADLKASLINLNDIEKEKNDTSA